MRALIIEDDSAQAALVQATLNRMGCTCEIADNGEDGLKRLMTRSFDVAVVDVVLPRMDGLEAVRQARKARVETPIIVLSARGEPEDVVSGFSAEADMYLPKPCGMEVLRAHVEALMRRFRRMGLCDEVSHAGIVLNRRTRQVSRNGRDIALSAFEFNLLELLLSNRGTVITYERIKNEVWSGRPSVTNHNIAQSVEGLRLKLCKHDRSDCAIENKRGVGYVVW